MQGPEARPEKKRRRKWGRYVFGALGVLLLGAAGVGYAVYRQLQPKNHFTHVPSLTANTSTAQQSTPTHAAFNVLLLGSDARPAGSHTTLSEAASHTDSILLVHVDLDRHEYDILSIPRDTRVYMPGYGHTKLTSVQLLAQSKYGEQQGILYAVKAIGQLTGAPIQYYAETDYWGLQDMVDAIGGITMNLPFPVTLTHPWYPEDAGLHFDAGPHFLNGKLVAEVVHERYSVPGTDYGRQQLQEAALVGIAKAVLTPQNLPKLPRLAQTLPNYLLATNMTTADLVSLGLAVKDFQPDAQVHYYQVTGKDVLIYNDALGAKDDEVLLDTNQLQQIVREHFLG
jgi:LCP family protein required for cell wall assembly